MSYMRSYQSKRRKRKSGYYAVVKKCGDPIRAVYLCRADGNTRRLRRAITAFRLSNTGNDGYIEVHKM